MSIDTVERVRQVDPAEHAYAGQLAFLAAYDDGPRPPGWRLTPRAVVTFIAGSDGRELKAGKDKRVIEAKFVGDRSLVERCVVTLAGERGLLLVGEPGTAKSMLSELLAAAVCGTSELGVQGSAGTTEDQSRYGWNYALLLAHGPSPEALVTVFRDLRGGRSVEGWDIERPSTVMSTAEAVAVASSLGLAAAYFPGNRDVLSLLPGHLLGVVRKDDPADGAKLLGYWDGP